MSARVVIAMAMLSVVVGSGAEAQQPGPTLDQIGQPYHQLVQILDPQEIAQLTFDEVPRGKVLAIDAISGRLFTGVSLPDGTRGLPLASQIEVEYAGAGPQFPSLTFAASALGQRPAFFHAFPTPVLVRGPAVLRLNLLVNNDDPAYPSRLVLQQSTHLYLMGRLLDAP